MTSRDKEKFKNMGLGAVVGAALAVAVPAVGNAIRNLLGQLGV